MLTIEKENINVETILKDAKLYSEYMDEEPFEIEAILDIRRQEGE